MELLFALFLHGVKMLMKKFAYYTQDIKIKKLDFAVETGFRASLCLGSSWSTLCVRDLRTGLAPAFVCPDSQGN